MKRLLFILCVLLAGLGVSVATVHAQQNANKIQKDLTPTLSQPIGGFGSPSDFGQATEKSVPWIGNYIRAIFIYGVSLAAVLALLMVMVGGFLWLTAGGRSDQVGRAKDYITSALLGLALALVSYMLLYTLNPRLVALEPLQIPEPQTVQPTSASTDPQPKRDGDVCCVFTPAQNPGTRHYSWTTPAACTQLGGVASSGANCTQ